MNLICKLFYLYLQIIGEYYENYRRNNSEIAKRSCKIQSKMKDLGHGWMMYYYIQEQKEKVVDHLLDLVMYEETK